MDIVDNLNVFKQKVVRAFERVLMENLVAGFEKEQFNVKYFEGGRTETPLLGLGKLFEKLSTLDVSLVVKNQLLGTVVNEDEKAHWREDILHFVFFQNQGGAEERAGITDNLKEAAKLVFGRLKLVISSESEYSKDMNHMAGTAYVHNRKEWPGLENAPAYGIAVSIRNLIQFVGNDMFNKIIADASASAKIEQCEVDAFKQDLLGKGK